jgi:hypothetical protein
MAITEGRRKRLYDKFEEVLGADNAEVMMELLPPVGWADVATNRELDQLRVAIEARFETSEHRMLAELYRESAGLRAEMAAGDAALRAEMAAGDAALRDEMTGGVAGLRAEIAAGDAALRVEIAELRIQLASSVRSLMICGTGLCTSLAGLAFTAGHLL